MSTRPAETEPEHRTLLIVAKSVYVLAIVAWASFVILYPPWIGQGYWRNRIYESSEKPVNGYDPPWIGRGDDRDAVRFGPWYPCGTFGLQRHWAPLWNPPRPAGMPRTHESVRWPWQPVSTYGHIEVNVSFALFQVVFGAWILGFLLRGFHWLVARRTPDRLVCVAWSLSLSLSIALLVALALEGFSSGFMPDSVISAVLACGVAGGLVYGTIACDLAGLRWLRWFRWKKSLQASDKAAAAGPSRLHSMATPLFRFTLGLATAFLISTAAAWIANLFRGPIIGSWELGTPRYADDQWLINLTTGLVIAATGWIGGGWLLRKRLLRAFAVGLLVGATALGLGFATWS
jgi:hypothetical protein